MSTYYLNLVDVNRTLEEHRQRARNHARATARYTQEGLEKPKRPHLNLLKTLFAR